MNLQLEQSDGNSMRLVNEREDLLNSRTKKCNHLIASAWKGNKIN